MRHFVPVLAVLAVGCAPQDASDFEYETTFAKQTRGLILHEDGESGHAGMFGTNCPFDVESGQVTGDYDLPDQDEEIQDGEPTEMGDITFTAVTEGVVHVVDKTGGMYTHEPVAVPGAQEARLAWDTVVVLDDRCRLKQFDFFGETVDSIPLDGCADADVEVDPDTATGVVASLGNTVRFDANGAHPLPVEGDMVAYDAFGDRYYLGTKGDTTLSAVSSSGELLWSIETPWPVTALDDAGMLESVAVVMERRDGRGEIGFFEGTAGDRTAAGITPSAAADLAVSNNGRTLALVRSEQSFFFRLLD